MHHVARASEKVMAPTGSARTRMATSFHVDARPTRAHRRRHQLRPRSSGCGYGMSRSRKIQARSRSRRPSSRVTATSSHAPSTAAGKSGTEAAVADQRRQRDGEGHDAHRQVAQQVGGGLPGPGGDQAPEQADRPAGGFDGRGVGGGGHEGGSRTACVRPGRRYDRSERPAIPLTGGRRVGFASPASAHRPQPQAPPQQPPPAVRRRGSRARSTRTPTGGAPRRRGPRGRWRPRSHPRSVGAPRRSDHRTGSGTRRRAPRDSIGAALVPSGGYRAHRSGARADDG